MAFPPSFLDDIRNRLPPSQVIGRRVRLTRKGREQLGLCPFHKEKTPSFTVNDDKGFYHCFGCGAHGDVIGFTMRIDNLPFPEAVERLAREAGLDMPISSPEERRREEEARTLLGATEAACQWFEAQLRAPGGRHALDYLKGRGLADETIGAFRLGFAPEGRGLLKQALKAKGFDEALLLEAGLLTKPEGAGESFDFFRGRVMFPILSARGQVLAFGGRTLGDGQPKYLNSRDTPLFDKGRTLYALDKAREPVRAGAPLIVVEGYMDVIALHAAGFGGAVAPLGTALTEAQIVALWRLQPEPRLCFDGDDAGQRAALRAADRALPLLKPGHSLQFVVLPVGEDPDSLIRRRGRDAMAAVLEQGRPLFDQVCAAELAGRPVDTPERRALVEQAIRDRIARIADRSVQAHYASQLRQWTWEVLRPRGSGRRSSPGSSAAARVSTLRAPGDVGTLKVMQAEALLATVINHPSLINEELETLSALDMPNSELAALSRAVVATAEAGKDLDSEALQSHLMSLGLTRALAGVFRQNTYHFWPFARPASPLEEARGGLKHIIGLLQQRRMAGEVDAAQREFARDMTERAWVRLEGLQRQADALAEDGEPAEDIVQGSASRH